MPELAEVEFYRRRWEAGLNSPVTRVHVHGTKRLFRGTDTQALIKTLKGAKLVSSAAHGKQMLFRFSRQAWLGIHLGMTGELHVEPPDFVPLKHDHLVLFQRKRALVFRDPRQFGRVLFALGKEEAPWWKDLPPRISSRQFTLDFVQGQLARHRTLPLKAALLDQGSFPGIGNWMADEILWQSRLHPRSRAGELNRTELHELWQMTRMVSRRALETVSKQTGGREFGDPPRGFLFHVRWRRGGHCPRDGAPLRHETIGGRTTAWCPRCQAE